MDQLPDRFAAIADIHGNADALAAVIADLRGQGVGAVVNLGDHFSGPLAHVETADLLLNLEQVTGLDQVAIRGNHDRVLVTLAPEDMGMSDRLAHQALDTRALDWLRGLPPTRTLGDVFLCHGTPKRDDDYWLEQVAPSGAVTLAAQDAIAARIGDNPACLFLCAHTHVARHVDLPGGRVVVNPGSVGCPGYRHEIPHPHVIQAGSPAARYAILTRTARGWASDFRAVPYDARRMARLACAAGQADWARVVGTGWLDR